MTVSYILLICAVDERPCSFFISEAKIGSKVRRAQGLGGYWVCFVVMCKLLSTAAFHERKPNK